MLASSQATIAPDISGISIQGSDISLSKFKDEKNVLIVFYRMQA
jgi:peroxiredoxin